ncbi:MAG: ABC transporter permease [Candidatus Dormibacteria bacterium]
MSLPVGAAPARRRVDLATFRVPAFVVLALGLLLLFLDVTPGKLTDPFVLTPSFVTSRLLRHVELVGLSFAGSTVIGLALGIGLAGRGRAGRLIAFLPANLGQAIPSVGALAIATTISGLGVTATVEALTVYGLLPIVRNCVAALQGVDGSLVDAARGMGMTPLQSLIRVRLPLASAGIFAGLRTSLVLIVGTATLGNFVGGGGMGDVIAAGYGNQSEHVIITGAVIVAALAILSDWALGLVEAAVTPHST